MHSGRFNALSLTLGALMLSALLLGGCDIEPYGACNMPRSQAIDETCNPEAGGEGETSSSANCVVDFVFECDSRLCATFEGTSPFCTERCADAADTGCPNNGLCVEFVVGTGEFFCISDAVARENKLRE